MPLLRESPRPGTYAVVAARHAHTSNEHGQRDSAGRHDLDHASHAEGAIAPRRLSDQPRRSRTASSRSAEHTAPPPGRTPRKLSEQARIGDAAPRTPRRR
jgi:hypothetical protein